MSTNAPLVLAFGDSLVAGYGLAADHSFPAQLQQRLRERLDGARVINAGVSGNTSGDALRRLPGVLSRLSERPDLAVVQIGANDVLRGLSPAQTRANLDAMLAEFGRCGIPVLLTTLEPPAFLRARTGAYLGIHKEVAERHGAMLASFFPAGVLGHPAMVLADRIHPNREAIRAVVGHVAPLVERLLHGSAGSLAA